MNLRTTSAVVGETPARLVGVNLMPYLSCGRFLISSEEKNAHRYFVDQLFIPHGIAGRIRWLLRIPTMRLAEKSEVEVVERLHESLRNEQLRCSIVLKDYDSNARGRVTAFLFDSAGSTPHSVVKVQRAPEGGERSLRTEAETLELMQRTLPPELRRTVPAVLRFESGVESELLITTMLSGRSAYSEFHTSIRPAAHLERHFGAAARWLASFHQATGGVPARSLVEVEATSPVHGDYWARNLLIDSSGSMNVVDWEDFTASGSPFIDLFHFPLTYGLAYPWTRYRRLQTEAAFCRTFLERNRLSKAVQQYFRLWCATTGIPVTGLKEAFRLYLQTSGTMGLPERERPGIAGLPWNTLAAQFDRASESVFSG
ncbi:MAG TPA: hypothetical protein VF701_21380 [Thermoanaerobaculia bacterium]